ncbi:hypothetical protein M9H77_23409 [Catharanthus roseus]|uniref:Uncharacterized protein n=1 Tax=Catharanthus roseus TaxID=4058 RepID=A0ACC0ATY3_CATRO|nr:hypothetical protein M9H77_23409 [Catharanthus roseus]
MSRSRHYRNPQRGAYQRKIQRRKDENGFKLSKNDGKRCQTRTTKKPTTGGRLPIADAAGIFCYSDFSAAAVQLSIASSLAAGICLCCRNLQKFLLLSKLLSQLLRFCAAS